MQIAHVLLMIIIGFTIYCSYFAVTDTIDVGGYIIDESSIHNFPSDYPKVTIFRNYTIREQVFSLLNMHVFLETVNVMIIHHPVTQEGEIVDYVKVFAFLHGINDEMFKKNRNKILDFDEFPLIMQETAYYDEDGRKYLIRCALFSKIKVETW